MAGFEYYWRVEPDVYFYCDQHRDPFKHMQAHNRSIAWTIMVRARVGGGGGAVFGGWWGGGGGGGGGGPGCWAVVAGIPPPCPLPPPRPTHTYIALPLPLSADA